VNNSLDIFDSKSNYHIISCSKSFSNQNHFAVSLSNKSIRVYDTYGSIISNLDLENKEA